MRDTGIFDWAVESETVSLRFYPMLIRKGFKRDLSDDSSEPIAKSMFNTAKISGRGVLNREWVGVYADDLKSLVLITQEFLVSLETHPRQFDGVSNGEFHAMKAGGGDGGVLSHNVSSMLEATPKLELALFLPLAALDRLILDLADPTSQPEHIDIDLEWDVLRCPVEEDWAERFLARLPNSAMTQGSATSARVLDITYDRPFRRPRVEPREIDAIT